MDPVSVFNALYDTKCLKFGRYNLKSGLVAPYYMNLRRLPLYPKLMEAVVTQVVEKFLTSQALFAASSQLRRQAPLSAPTATSTNSTSSSSSSLSTAKLPSPIESDADSQLEDELVETASEDGDWEKVCHSFEPIICGVPYGAVPLAAAVAYMAQLPYLFERKDAKSYGDQQSLMDDFNSDSREQASGGDGGSTQASQRRQRVILIEDVICSGESILDAVKSLERQNLKVEFVICIVDREENGVNLLLEQFGIRVLSLYNMSAILRVLEATGRITSEQFHDTRQWMAQSQFVKIGLDPSKCK